MTEASPIRVLVVDDERSILLSLAEFLEDYDFEVSLASDAAEALKILETHSQGISYIQLKYMLGTTPFQASKVIDELIRMDLIHRSIERDLLHVNTDLLAVMH